MTTNKKILLLIIISITIICYTIFYYNKNKIINVNIISFGDLHGMIEDKNEIGATRFFYAIKKEIKPDTLIITAGDNFNGEAMSNLLFGRPLTEIFRNINITASTIGNHDLDWGIDKISIWEKEMNAPFISANILKDGEHFTKPYIIKEINGIKIAFIGLTTMETVYKGNTTFIKHLKFLDPVETAKKFVERVKNRGADIVVLLTHIGSYIDQNTKQVKFENDDLMELTKIDGVNLIITAHYHNLINEFVNNVPVIQSSYKGRAFAIIDFTVNKYTKKILDTKINQNILIDKKNNLEEDFETIKIIKKYNDQISTILNENIGIIHNKISYDKYKKSPLGDLFCKILKNETNSDIAVLNGGNINGELDVGLLKVENVYSILPFDNLCVTLNIKGKYIKNMIDRDIDDKEIGELQYSGLTKENDNYILDNGEVLDDEKYYKLATNDFVLNGGDLYDLRNAKDIEEIGYVKNIIIDGLKKIIKDL